MCRLLQNIPRSSAHGYPSTQDPARPPAPLQRWVGLARTFSVMSTSVSGFLQYLRSHFDRKRHEGRTVSSQMLNQVTAARLFMHLPHGSRSLDTAGGIPLPYPLNGRGAIERCYETRLPQERIPIREFPLLCQFGREHWNFDRHYNSWLKQEPLD